MHKYSRFVMADLLDAFASNEPVPGGGAAAALAGAVGVSLLQMVAGLPKSRTGAPEEVADLAEASARLRPLREALAGLVDRDCEAYRSVLAAARMPKDRERDAAVRRDALEAAMRAATDTPLETMRACQQALRGAVIVAERGASSARSDVGVAVELLAAALRGAASSLDANLGSIRDAVYVERVRVERQQLESDGTADAERARRTR